MKVWIGAYEHKHGTDVCAYATKEGAERAAGLIAEEYAIDVEDAEVEANILELVANGNFLEAANAYFNSDRIDESFDITETEVLP